MAHFSKSDFSTFTKNIIFLVPEFRKFETDFETRMTEMCVKVISVEMFWPNSLFARQCDQIWRHDDKWRKLSEFKCFGQTVCEPASVTRFGNIMPFSKSL